MKLVKKLTFVWSLVIPGHVWHNFVLRWRDRRIEIYSNTQRAPDVEAANSYYDYMSVYIEALRDHQYKLRDDIL